MKVAIIGAGISGLVAAYELTKCGHRVTVFEREKTPGGLGTYIPTAGDPIEAFYHHFFKTDYAIQRLASELGLREKLNYYKAKTGVWSNGRLFPFSTPTDLLRFEALSLTDRLRCGASTAFLKFLPFSLRLLDTISAADWVKRYAGRQVHQKLWGPLLEGKFSTYAAEVPALWLWGRLRDRSFSLGYFVGSVKTLYDALIGVILEGGGKIRLSYEVASVQPFRHGVQVEACGKRVSFDRVLLTTASPISAKLLFRSLPTDTERFLSSIDHLGAVCVVVELARPLQSQYWLNICDKDAPVLVVIEHTNMIPSSRYAGKTLVYLANYLHRTHSRYKESEKSIVREYTAFLKVLNPAFRRSWISHLRLMRVPRAQTIFRLGALQRLPPMRLLPNVFMVNIDQMYPHDRNLNQGVVLGQKVAQLILR